MAKPVSAFQKHSLSVRLEDQGNSKSNIVSRPCSMEEALHLHSGMRRVSGRLRAKSEGQQLFTIPLCACISGNVVLVWFSSKFAWDRS